MPHRASGSESPKVGILDWDTDFFGFRVGRVFDAKTAELANQFFMSRFERRERLALRSM